MTLSRRISFFAACLAAALLQLPALAANAKLPVFRVNSYGAKPDGQTLDTHAIQAKPSAQTLPAMASAHGEQATPVRPKRPWMQPSQQPQQTKNPGDSNHSYR